MSSSSYFWANLGVLEKVGVWSPFYDTARPPNARLEFLYVAFRRFMTMVCMVHTFVELFLIAYDVHSLTMEELTVSIAYGIQHLLGIGKVFLLISQHKAVIALDNSTREAPLYRSDDESFKKSLKKCVTLSDRIGYMYWFFVLVTISFGGATGVFVTYKNRKAMDSVCGEKMDFYNGHYADQIASMLQQPYQAEGTVEMHAQVGSIEEQLRMLNLTLSTPEMPCKRPKRVFPYHVWLPFNGKRSPIYEVYFVLNFLSGLSLVCWILPIDLMVMSYLRYMRFQFAVLKKDLLNLRTNSIADVQRMRKRGDFAGNHLPEEELLTQQIIRRLKQIIHHQLAIFDFFRKTNDLFTWVLFAQYLGSAIMICGVLYTISSVVGDMKSPKFFHVAFFYTGLIFQLYSNCYYGNEVLLLSGGIAEYAYFSGWHESGAYTARLKPYIIMIMTQSLHPCKLTAGKFAGVDLPTFLAVFKASYTYYTVLVDDGTR